MDMTYPTIDPNYIQSLFPEELRDLVGETFHCQQINVGRSGDLCFRVVLRDRSFAFLKIHTSSTKEYFSHEIAAISWLNTFVPTPRIVATGKSGFHNFLLISALTGKDIAHCDSDLSRDQIINICATSMRILHEIPIDNCPLDQRLNAKIPRAKDRMAKGLVSLSNLDPIRSGWNADQLLRELDKMVPADEDLVVTHGDFCLPNLIADDTRFSGFIDLGSAGIADRHQDIVLCLKSLERNIGQFAREQFLENYELVSVLDEAKLDFYDLLDEFF